MGYVSNDDEGNLTPGNALACPSCKCLSCLKQIMEITRNSSLEIMIEYRFAYNAALVGKRENKSQANVWTTENVREARGNNEWFFTVYQPLACYLKLENVFDSNNFV